MIYARKTQVPITSWLLYMCTFGSCMNNLAKEEERSRCGLKKCANDFYFRVILRSYLVLDERVKEEAC